jgi:hypothetical protein
MKFIISKSLGGSQEVLDLQKDALNLKKKVEKLKENNKDTEIDKALGDALSSLDIFDHHMQDIYGD